MRNGLEKKFLIRRELEEALKTIQMENEEKAKDLEKLKNLSVNTRGDLYADVIFEFFLFFFRIRI